jgi:hypothetical protein
MGLNSRQGGGSALDPDARLYIADVEAVLPGNSIETALPNASNPKRIISDFIKAEKAASRWSLHKRIYLPIYANAAASAIDMVSRASGTFTGIGSVIHAAGYVQGDKTSGFFNFNISPSSAGLTSTSGIIGFLSKQTRTAGVIADTSIGCENSTSQRSRISGTLNADFYTNLNRASLVSGIVGIITASRTSSSLVELRKRSFSSVVGSDNTGISAGTVPTVNMFAMANNSNGTATGFCDAQYGAFFMGLGLDAANADAFSANLKTLWESLTGLTLP